MKAFSDKSNYTGISTLLIFLLILAPGLIIRILSLDVPFFYHHDWDWAVFGNQAWDILNGRLSTFRYAQSYLGTLPLCVDVMNFAIFGPTRKMLFMGSIYYWVFYVISLYFLGKMIFSRTAGLVAAALASISTTASLYLSVQPSRAYLDVMLMGNIIFILTLSLTKSSRAWKWLLLGLVCGGCFWTSLIAIYYITPAGIILLGHYKTKMFPAKLLLWLAAFAVGSLPFWIYNIFNHRMFMTFDMLHGTGHVESYLANAICFFRKLFFIFHIQFDSPEHLVLSAMVLIMLAASIVWPIVYLARRIAKQDRGNLCDYGAGMLVIFFITAFLMNITSSKYGSVFSLGIRYVMPLYTFFYLIPAHIFVLAGKKHRALFPALTIVVLVFNIMTQLESNDRLPGQTAAMRSQAYALYLEDTRQICELFKSQNARYIGTEHNNVDGIILSFDAIPFGLNFLEPIDKYTPIKSLYMDDQPESFRIDRSGRYKSALKTMGFDFRTKCFASFEAIFNINKPFEEFEMLPAEKYTLTSSHEQKDIYKAKDGIITSRWLTKEQDAWIEITTNDDRDKIAKIILSNKTSFREMPSRLYIEGYNEAVNSYEMIHDLFVTPGAISYGDKIIERPSGAAIEIVMPHEKEFRRVRIRKPGEEAWSLNELFVMKRKPEQSATKRQDRDAISAMIKELKPDMVYADEFIAARIMLSSNIPCFNDYELSGAEHKKCHSERKMDFSGKTAIIVEDAFAAHIEKLLTDTAINFKTYTQDAMRIFLTAPTPLPVNLFWLGYCAVTYQDIGISFRLSSAAKKLWEAGNEEETRQMAESALNFDPENYLALKLLNKTERIKELEPETKTDIQLMNYCTIAGCTVTDRHDKKEIRVFADIEKSCPVRCHPVLYGLDKNEEVLFSLEPKAWKRFNETAFWPEGNRVVFKGEMQFPERNFQLWLAFLDENGKRIPIKSVNSKAPQHSNRCILKEF